MSRKTELSSLEKESLAEIAGLMVPASREHGVPGADDPAIMAEITDAALRDPDATSTALSAYRDLDASDRPGRAQAFRRDHPDAAAHLEALIIPCYYRDERILRALGMEARPPFPKGYEVRQGDWSLLDPVRAMAPLYRPVD